MELNENTRHRISLVAAHMRNMEHERQGYGPAAMEDVHATAMSFMHALALLMEAERWWADGATGLSFGGVMPGGIDFGMIARERPATPTNSFMEFEFKPIEWTFHS